MFPYTWRQNGLDWTEKFRPQRPEIHSHHSINHLHSSPPQLFTKMYVPVKSASYIRAHHTAKTRKAVQQPQPGSVQHPMTNTSCALLILSSQASPLAGNVLASAGRASRDVCVCVCACAWSWQKWGGRAGRCEVSLVCKGIANVLQYFCLGHTCAAQALRQAVTQGGKGEEGACQDAHGSVITTPYLQVGWGEGRRKKFFLAIPELSKNRLLFFCFDAASPQESPDAGCRLLLE